MLIGNSDTRTSDDGKLRVTLHHNHFHACKERTPRVRFGRVHVASNLFSADRAEDFGYALGIGLQSRIVSEFNAWELPAGIPPEQLIRVLKGNTFVDRGSRLNGRPVSLQQGLSADVGWRPEDAYDTAALRPADPNRLVEQIRSAAGPRRA